MARSLVLKLYLTTKQRSLLDFVAQSKSLPTTQFVRAIALERAQEIIEGGDRDE